jgi:hypothetical protein
MVNYGRGNLRQHGAGGVALQVVNYSELKWIKINYGELW